MEQENSNENNQRRNKVFTMNIYIKIALILCLGFVLSFSTVYANSHKQDLNAVYHVYIDGKYVGKVNNESVIERTTHNLLDTQKNKSKNIDFMIEETIDVVSEKVFDPSYDNDKVIKALENNITVNAKSYAITIDDETIGHFATEEIAEDVLRNYKLEYVKKTELNEIDETKKDAENNKEKQSKNKKRKTSKNEEEIEIGKKVVRDVSFSKDVSIVEKSADPDDILSLKQGKRLISKGTLENKKHKIVAGDVFENIAKEYELTIEELRDLNSDITQDSILQIGEELNVTVFEPYMDVIVTEELLEEEVATYETEIIESDDMYKGEEKTKQSGKDGKKEVHYKIKKTNGSKTKKEVIEETITEEPIEKIIIKGTKVIPSQGSGNLSWPVDGGYVSSEMGPRWGRMHKGIDIARPSTRTITAADHGVVESVGRDGGYGNKIVINHNNGMKTIYAHLSSIDVTVGQAVEKGMHIGVMGSTGNSTGIHLHFEVYENGNLKNPLDYF